MNFLLPCPMHSLRTLVLPTLRLNLWQPWMRCPGIPVLLCSWVMCSLPKEEMIYLEPNEVELQGPYTHCPFQDFLSSFVFTHCKDIQWAGFGWGGGTQIIIIKSAYRKQSLSNSEEWISSKQNGGGRRGKERRIAVLSSYLHLPCWLEKDLRRSEHSPSIIESKITDRGESWVNFDCVPQHICRSMAKGRSFTSWGSLNKIFALITGYWAMQIQDNQ